MSEEIKEIQDQTEDPQLSVMRIYVRKQEELIADFCRRLVNAEMNLEIATNSFKQAHEQNTTSQTQIKQLLQGLQEVTAERNKLVESAKIQNSGLEETKAIIAERDKAVKQRDDYYREMQHQITNNNVLSDKIQKLEAELKEFRLRESLEANAPRKKVAKVKE